MSVTSLNTSIIPPVHHALCTQPTCGPQSNAYLLLVLGFLIAASAVLGIRFVMAKPERVTDDKKSVTPPPQQRSVKTSPVQKYIASVTLVLFSVLVLVSLAPTIVAAQPSTRLIPPIPSAQPPSTANPTRPGPNKGNTPDSIGGANQYLAIWNANAGLGSTVTSDVTPLSPFTVVDSKQGANHFSIQQNNGVATSLGQWYQGGGVSYWEQSVLDYFNGYVGIEIDLWKWTGTSWNEILLTGTGPNGDIVGYYCPYSEYPTYTVSSTIVFND
jgi:hypothetical protein